MNRKQWIVFGLIWLIVIVGTVFMIFKEESHITEKGIEIQELESVDVIVEDRKLSIYSFKDGVTDINWMNPDQIKLTGTSSGNSTEETYIFDVKNQTMKLSEQTDLNTKIVSFDVLEDLGDGKYLCIRKNDTELIVLSEDSEHVLTEDATYDENLAVVVSSSKKKIAYYDVKSQKIRIYNIETGKTASLNVFPDELILKDFRNKLLFSPDSGYLALYYCVPESIQETYFSVYGADSGRSYSEKIWGLSPSWAPEELKIAFVYGDGASNIKNQKNLELHHGKRIGYYDLKKRKSEYIGAILNAQEIMGDIQWQNNGKVLGYHTGLFNETLEKWTVTHFTTFNLDDKTFVTHSLPQEMVAENLLGWELYENYYFVVENNDGNYSLFIKDRINDGVSYIKDCEDFIVDDAMRLAILLGNEILYKKDGFLFLTNANKNEAVYTNDGLIKDMKRSPDHNQLSIVSENEGETLIEIIKAKDNVSVQ